MLIPIASVALRQLRFLFTLSVLLGLVGCGVIRNNERPKPWQKDLTKVDIYDATDALGRSPWSHSRVVDYRDFGDGFGPSPVVFEYHTLLSLPVRLARTRFAELRSQRPDIPDYDFSKVVVLQVTIDGDSVHRMVETAWLRFPDGRIVLPERVVTHLRNQKAGWFDALFPRFINGRPLIQPNDKKVFVYTGWIKDSKRKIGGRSEFRTKDLLYQGKLEY